MKTYLDASYLFVNILTYVRNKQTFERYLPIVEMFHAKQPMIRLYKQKLRHSCRVCISMQPKKDKNNKIPIKPGWAGLFIKPWVFFNPGLPQKPPGLFTSNSTILSPSSCRLSWKIGETVSESSPQSLHAETIS